MFNLITISPKSSTKSSEQNSLNLIKQFRFMSLASYHSKSSRSLLDVMKRQFNLLKDLIEGLDLLIQESINNSNSNNVKVEDKDKRRSW